MIIGHQKIWQYLIKISEQNKLPHGLLFFGPEKTGKKTLAFEFVKRFFNKDFRRKPNPDFIYIEPDGKEIKINQIRECIWKLSLKPSFSPLKIVIIDQAHFMNSEAQNCFLKTLEEPRGGAILILITEYPELLFPTIISRLQKIRFSLVGQKEIENYLKERKIPEEEIKEILEISAGRPGIAVDLVRAPNKLKQRKERINELLKIINSDLVFRFRYAKKISEDVIELKGILDIWLSYFRKKLFHYYSIFGDNYSRTAFFNRGEKLKKIIESIQDTIFLISKTNINQRLALEILMLEL